MLLLNFGKYSIAIHIFQERGSYLWIGSQPKLIKNIRWFNDVPRAMQKYVQFLTNRKLNSISFYIGCYSFYLSGLDRTIMFKINN